MGRPREGVEVVGVGGEEVSGRRGRTLRYRAVS